MSYPRLPAPAPGEVLLVCTCYCKGQAEWGEVFDDLGGRDGDVVVLSGGMRLRAVADPRWDYLQGGNLPALVEGGDAPVIAVADSSAVFGGDDVLLVDLKGIPGRGVRVPSDELGRILTELAEGSLAFGELVRGMDRFGHYRGDGGAPSVPAPTEVVRTSFPQLPAAPEVTLLVRTGFADEQGWRALMSALGEPADDEESDEGQYYEEVEFCVLVVDDRAFEDLQPGQAPALVPPGRNTTMVALADATALAEPGHPLLLVDLYDTPGHAIRIPLAEAGSVAVNLELANMDFAEFDGMDFSE
ncbi:DUF6924 domain-containing protein [Actinomadura macrotermitis]|uniref:DUF6924 domain-containing protein n=1 Tax=Actinomadura macrotermitis TaxID=2585200 RepID=A0A7K0BRU4_9ACTN|nr:hypothetical protein [Actinomadura macrotermitis]MQY03746.1 hypothetical protein [Actinomadura macrotermitis]